MSTQIATNRAASRRMSAAAPVLCLVGCLGLAAGGAARADVFGTSSAISADPAEPLLHGEDDGCRHGPVAAPLTLFEAIERSLCESPKTRSAWAAVKSAAAGLGSAKSAYLPQLDGTATAGHERNRTEVSGPQDLNSDYSQSVNEEALQLTWVLFDFGGRSAAVKNSRQLLLAAQANQNSILQAAFANTAKDYYAAQAAAARVQSARRIEAGSTEEPGRGRRTLQIRRRSHHRPVPGQHRLCAGGVRARRRGGRLPPRHGPARRGHEPAAG